MSIINPLARDSYKMCKSLRHPTVCEVLPGAPPISDVITSYMIKNVVFLLNDENAFANGNPKDLLVQAEKIYTRLRCFFKDGNLCLFLCPEQHILHDCWIKQENKMEMFQNLALEYCDYIVKKLQLR